MANSQRKPEDLREACVAEALAIIGESGVEHLSLREVARRLNVSHQAPYKHFQSRDHILAEVVSRAFQTFADYLDQRPRSEDPGEDMATMGQAYLEYAQAHSLHYRLMFETPLPNPHEHPEMMRKAEHAFALLKEAISKLPERQSAQPVELEALFVWSVMHGLAGILRGCALESLHIPRPMLESAIPFALQRIGLALGMEEDECLPDEGAP
jgi:AcrR family transcriptional regulator